MKLKWKDSVSGGLWVLDLGNQFDIAKGIGVLGFNG